MTKHLLIAAGLMLLPLTISAQQFSKADQAVIANYPITVEKVNQYLVFEKGFAAAKAAEPKYASLTPPRTLDEKINLLSTLPSFTELAKSAGSNLREITLTGSALHILFVATDPKRQANFLKSCDQGYVEKPSVDQMAFAEAHRAELTQWQKQIIEFGRAGLSQ